MTRFEQFQQNVQRWATERGIYEHSTALAQALKAVSEVGELCDAVIKNDRDALIDAIGDSAVTLVNAGHFYQHEWDAEFIYDREMPDRTSAGCAAVTAKFTGELAARADDRGLMGGLLDTCMYCLFAVALRAELDFDDCCEAAWQTIKDRRGKMVAGGAFVKEGE